MCARNARHGQNRTGEKTTEFHEPLQNPLRRPESLAPDSANRAVTVNDITQALTTP